MTLVPTAYENRDWPRSSGLLPYFRNRFEDTLTPTRWLISELLRYPRLPWEQQLEQIQKDLTGNNYWPWPLIESDGERMIVDQQTGLQVALDVRHFKPNEVLVKTTDDCIVVEGNHVERNEGGRRLVERHFIRKYLLPQGFNPHDVTSTLSSDGILTIKAPPPPPPKCIAPTERLVRIQHTGRTSTIPALKWK